MCGIAGFAGFVDSEKLALTSNEIQKHRGPDNQSIWQDDWIALSHQRLSIIDLSERANQPLLKSNYVIIFNGEIYNYKILKEEINKIKSIDFLTSSDTEVVLEYYKHYGEKCLDFFEGMFSFAIYEINEQSLFIARDHFGIKPLFYTQIDDKFAFSSELKSLVSVPNFNHKINSKALISSLNYLWVSGNDTMFEDCYKLPPAHYLKIKKDQKLEIRKYWDLEEEILQKTEKEIIEELSEVIQASMKRHMESDVPVSAFLSGGLDSSIIAVLAKQYNPQLSTFTIATSKEDKKIEKMPEDELYARKLAELHHFDHHEILIQPDIVKLLPEMVYALDEPIGDPAAINTFLMCEAARKKGIKVILSGMGADEIFFGYRRQKAILIASNYQRIPVFIRNVIAYFVGLLPVKVFGRGWKISRWAKKFITFASLPLAKATMRSMSYYERNELQELLVNNEDGTIDKLDSEFEKYFNAKFKDDVINQICNTDINMFMTFHNLSYTDRASMAASVEVRVPFIDKKLLTYGMKIPGKLKYKKNQSKYILKKVAEKILPLSIIYRPKASFGAPIRSWISGALKPLVDDLLSKESIGKRGIFNYDFIQNLIEKDRDGREDNAYRIYQLLTIELWFREYVDKYIYKEEFIQ